MKIKKVSLAFQKLRKNIVHTCRNTCVYIYNIEDRHAEGIFKNVFIYATPTLYIYYIQMYISKFGRI